DRADDLDHLDLLTASRSENDVERRLLLCGSGAVARSRSSGDGHRRCRRDAPLLLELVLQVDELEDGHPAQRLDELVRVRFGCHYCSSPSGDSCSGSAAGSSSVCSGSASAAGSSAAGSSAAASSAGASSAAGSSA